jgi:hypothetical protein
MKKNGCVRIESRKIDRSDYGNHNASNVFRHIKKNDELMLTISITRSMIGLWQLDRLSGEPLIG